MTFLSLRTHIWCHWTNDIYVKWKRNELNKLSVYRHKFDHKDICYISLHYNYNVCFSIRHSYLSISLSKNHIINLISKCHLVKKGNDLVRLHKNLLMIRNVLMTQWQINYFQIICTIYNWKCINILYSHNLNI